MRKDHVPPQKLGNLAVSTVIWVDNTKNCADIRDSEGTRCLVRYSFFLERHKGLIRLPLDLGKISFNIINPSLLDPNQCPHSAYFLRSL